MNEELKGLLRHALDTGELDALTDYLIERSADPDLARAVRENAARIVYEMAEEAYRARMQRGDVNDATSRELVNREGPLREAVEAIRRNSTRRKHNDI